MVPWAHPSEHLRWHLDQFICFLQSLWHSPYILQWTAVFLCQNCAFTWWIWTPSNTWFQAHAVNNPYSISICSAVFAGLTTVTYRPTDRPRYSICNSTLHLRSSAIRSDNNNNYAFLSCCEIITSQAVVSQIMSLVSDIGGQIKNI